eukprot:TRINITY_DN26840_c0_g1_i1.p1 TRINITY_DN26840_c0_g1~~TRINITY_DN26840_c0_g1_i1.p1  ORF type:complete len:331 (+),score=56.50 TRINITY_DN26840_c0_g1_i1:121-1113(+)
MGYRQSFLGKKSLLAACLVLAAVRVSSPLLAFIVTAPAQSGNRLPASAVVRRSASAASASAGIAGAQSENSSSVAAAALAACAVAGFAAFSAASQGSSRNSTSSRQAVALKACFDSSNLTASAMTSAEFSFTGETGSMLYDKSEPISSKVTRHLLMPRQWKWKKPHKPSVKPFRNCTTWKYRGEAPKGNQIAFGKYALQVLEEGWMVAKDIEWCRQRIVQSTQRKGKGWIRVFPHRAITRRVAESRMGAGKGSIDHWVAVFRPGFILFEMDNCTEYQARWAFRKCRNHFTFRSRFIMKSDGPSRFELGLAGSAKPKTKSIPIQFRKDLNK